MKIFIAGICGTFMAGIAQLAKAGGHEVSGCDNNVYPPMSTLLETENIDVRSGYLSEHISDHPDQVVIGNALCRGNPLIETVLNDGHQFQSGPQWLHDNILRKRNVIAVAGTHGKTSTSSMVNWILHSNQNACGYLIGGKPGNFDHSAQLGISPWFVIEADEYDTAFFDKRSKFVHYKPHIAVLNNLEFDHADIFDNLEQIKTQFHHLIRIVPANGYVVVNSDDDNLASVLQQGYWSERVAFSIMNKNAPWFAEKSSDDYSTFTVYQNGEPAGNVKWSCIGKHNMQNALAAIASAAISGINITQACNALTNFVPAARRLQLLFNRRQTWLYEDFAHHPTAIGLTIEALRSKHPNCRISAVLEPRSNTMKSGRHGDALGESLNQADICYLYQSTELDWQPQQIRGTTKFAIHTNKEELIEQLCLSDMQNHVIICMSNGSFDGIPRELVEHLSN